MIGLGLILQLIAAATQPAGLSAQSTADQILDALDARKEPPGFLRFREIDRQR